MALREAELRQPWAWYGFAIVTGVSGAFMCWILWFSARLHPTEFPVGVDFVVIGLAGALFALAAGLVRIGIAFKRGEQWTGRVMFAVHALVAVYVLMIVAYYVALFLGFFE